MEQDKQIKSGKLWQHKKSGGVYQIVTICTIEETDTPAVMYKGLNVVQRDDFWVRPVDNFLERFTVIDLNVVQIAELLKAQHGNQAA